MRGDERLQEEMFSYGSLSQRVPQSHPLRRIRRMADEVMVSLGPRLEQMYSKMGRPSVPPEQLLRALLLQMLYSVGSERMLVEQIEYNLLFRWFVGLGDERAGVGCEQLHEEPGASSARGCGAAVLCFGGGFGAAAAAFER